MTLNLVLGYFQEYSKVIYLYSCGIPSDALQLREETYQRVDSGRDELVYLPVAGHGLPTTA